MKTIPVLVIFGPTASGKTDTLTRLFGAPKSAAEVISADSMQVYRGMDIGTAKPDAAARSALPHHLLDVVSPDEQFTAGDFVREADRLCKEITARGKRAVVAGGTGFYIRNFLLGLPVTPEGRTATRQNLKARILQEGSEALHAELANLDPVSAQRIHVNDGYRIVRALEVCMDSGKALSSFALPQTLRSGYDFHTFILTRPREELYSRIDARVDAMFEAGLEDEAARLIEAGYTKDDPGMRAIGYREFFAPAVLEASGKEKTLLVKEHIKRDTKRYAKRQEVFMRGIPGARVIFADDITEIM
jgi:tRNA dimethylallyltransferase